MRVGGVGEGAATPKMLQEKLQRACQEFEGLFLSLLYREMQNTVSRSGLMPSGAGGEMFQLLWGQELGRTAARSSHLGIADMLAGALLPELTASPKPR